MKARAVRSLRVLPILLLALLIPIAFASAESAVSAPLMPMPAHIVKGNGMYLISGEFQVTLEGYKDARLERAKARFLEMLFRETGIPLRDDSQAKVTFNITTAGASKPVQELGEDESYQLAVTPDGVRLKANNALGAMHGLQTFLQLVRVTPQGFAVPAVTIDDQPRFPWRGLMIDTSRHFEPLPVIKRNLDGMESVKLNVFHWHLSDNQGFRVESKVFPLLQEKGSNGQYYTQEQVKEVIDYARDRGIRVVPEFDTPCHTTAWFVGYPDLASGKGPYSIETHWGIFNPAMDPTRESTYKFLDRLFGEMAGLFPDAYFHIGGDECNGKEWDANERIQEFKRAHNLKDNAALQAYFTGRVQKIVTSHHKITMGWDEVLQPDTPKDVLIQSWRGSKGLAAAARQGNPVILSNGYYIDLNQPAEEHYLVDPFGGEGAALTDEQKKLVLGGEAAMWSEFVTQENIDSRIWPRTAAIAERLWSPQDLRDVNSMYARLNVISQKLDYYGLHHNSFTRMMLQRMSGETDPQALEVLASVVQPPLGYQRESLGIEYDSTVPLNRLVDAVPPESETAREFKQLVDAIVSGKATPEQWDRARSQFVVWRQNDARLAPQLSNSELTAELIPVSSTLSATAAIGLQALDELQTHHATDNAELQQRLDTLKSAEKPQAALRDMTVKPVEELVRAAGAQ